MLQVSYYSVISQRSLVLFWETWLSSGVNSLRPGHVHSNFKDETFPDSNVLYKEYISDGSG